MSFKVAINKAGKFPVVFLEDEKQKSVVEIYSFGALLNTFSIATKNGILNIIDGFSSVEDAEKNIASGFKSAKLSPFVCRMNKGEYSFNNTVYKTSKFYLPPHAIHGLVYDFVYEITSTTSNENFAAVTLAAKYEANDNGYPFYYTIQITYTLERNNQLSVTTKIINNSQQEIPVADGWHPYFMLGTKVDDCTLQFNSTTLVEFDETLIPTGKLIEENNFEEETSLQNIFLDNCYKLNKNGVCKLSNSLLELSIAPSSNYPFLQIYTPPHRNSIAIENLSAIPDCFNNKMGLLLLQPQQEYSFTTVYAVKVKM